MSTEVIRPTSYSGNALSDAGNAYDTDASTYSTQSTSSLTTQIATLSGFANNHTYTALTLTVKWAPTTNGNGGTTTWDGYSNIYLSVDGGSTWSQSGFTTSSSVYGAAGSAGGGDGSGSSLSEGPWTDTIALSVTDATQVQVKTGVSGQPKSGALPNVIMAGLGRMSLYDVYLTGTYASTPTVTSLNGGSSCDIGSSYNIVGTNFTGATSVSINGYSASYTVTNSTTISVTIPPMSLTSDITNCAVSVTTSTGTGSANVGNVTCPVIASISPAPTDVTAGTSLQLSTTITHVNPTTPKWYITQQNGTGSVTQAGYVTWPSSLFTDGYTCSVSVWPLANDGHSPTKSLSVYVRYAPQISSFTSDHTYVTNGGSATLTPTFAYGTGHAYIGTTNGGAQVTSSATSGTGYSVTPPSNTTTTYYLQVQNAAGTSVSSSLSITSVAAPSISSFTASTTTPAYGATNVTITPTFSGGTAVIGTSGYGSSDISSSATSGAAITVQGSGFTTATTYYLRVTNQAGATADSSITITPQNVIISAITSSAARVFRTHAAAFSATVSNAVDTNVNWWCSGGSFNPSTTASGAATTWTAGPLKGNFIIMAFSDADSTKYTTYSIEVVNTGKKSSTGNF